jgi:hypothetical protein
MLAAPDKRYSFDHARQITSFSHLLDEHINGYAKNRRSHIIDVLINIEKRAEHEIERRISEIEKDSHMIHFHVWDAASFISFVKQVITTFYLPLSIIYHEEKNCEIIVVMRKAEV